MMPDAPTAQISLVLVLQTLKSSRSVPLGTLDQDSPFQWRHAERAVFRSVPHRRRPVSLASIASSQVLGRSGRTRIVASGPALTELTNDLRHGASDPATP